jgi:hypothetical protein
MKRLRYRWDNIKDRLDDVLAKIGPITSVRGYRYFGYFQTQHEAVLVKGQNGSVRITGILWGFNGEHSRPTVTLLERLGIHKERAEHIVFNSERSYPHLGVDWFVRFLPNRRLLVLRRDQIEELAQDGTTAKLLGMPRPVKASKKAGT